MTNLLDLIVPAVGPLVLCDIGIYIACVILCLITLKEKG